MIHSHKNGQDFIKIESKDTTALEIILETINDIKLFSSPRYNGLHIVKYNVSQLYECLIKTHNLIDWKVTGSLLETMKGLMPLSTFPSDWILATVIEKSLVVPRKYQVEGINKIIKCSKKGFLLNDDFGVGKTVQAILAAQILQKEFGTLLIICPSYLKNQWMDQISKTCPDLDYRIKDFNEKVSKEKLLIIDEAHLSINTTKRRNRMKKICANAEKIIALTGVDLSEQPEDFSVLVNMIGNDVSERIIKNNFDKGILGLLKNIPELTALYLRRTKKELGLNIVKNVIFIESDPKLTKISTKFLKETDFSVPQMTRMLEINTVFKVKGIIKYISDMRRLNNDCKIAIFSQFPRVLSLLKDRINGSLIYNDTETESNTTLYLSSVYKSGIEVNCDILVIADPFMDSTSNIQVESRSSSGLIVKILHKEGIDEILNNGSKFASAKRNLVIIKESLSRKE